MPISGNGDSLDIFIDFPDFYKVNVTGCTSCKIIGLVGVNYTGYVYVYSPNKDMNLTNRSLQFNLIHKNEEKINADEFFLFNNIPVLHLDHYSLNLPEKLHTTALRKHENRNFSFTLFFYETGLYELSWKEKEESDWNVKLISIVEPLEYEQLTKQAELIGAEKESAESAQKTAIWTLALAIVTAFLVAISFGTVIVSYRTSKQIKNSLIYDVLSKLQMEYRTPQMQYAVKKLWYFYKECKYDVEKIVGYKEEQIKDEKERKDFLKKVEGKIQEEYSRIYKEEKIKLLETEKDYKVGKPIEYLENTLDYQRRLVSQFYDHLAALYVNNIIDLDIILKIWHKSDLKIIEDVIVPMEEELIRIERLEKEPNYSILRQLCNDVNKPKWRRLMGRRIKP